jgi:hypothetical protein
VTGNFLICEDGELILRKTLKNSLYESHFQGDGTISQIRRWGLRTQFYDTLELPKTTDGDQKTIATQEWTYGELSGKTDLSALDNYLPLSGDTKADVVTRSLSAIENVVYGFPNTSGTIGPDAKGNHYGGVFIGNNCVDIQDSATTMAVKWSGTKINAFGEITIKEKNGSNDVVTYDTLIFPKTQTPAH